MYSNKHSILAWKYRRDVAIIVAEAQLCKPANHEYYSIYSKWLHIGIMEISQSIIFIVQLRFLNFFKTGFWFYNLIGWILPGCTLWGNIYLLVSGGIDNLNSDPTNIVERLDLRWLVRTFPTWLWLVEIFTMLWSALISGDWSKHFFFALIGWNLSRSQVIGPYISYFALIGWNIYYAVKRLDLRWLVHTFPTLLGLVEICMLWSAYCKPQVIGPHISYLSVLGWNLYQAVEHLDL